MESTQLVSVKRIQPPAWYLRGSRNKENFQKLLNYIKEAKDLAAEMNTPFVWPVVDPVHPILLRPIKKSGDHDLETVDGAHRIGVAIKLGIADVPAVIRSYASDGEAYTQQLLSNLGHGLGVDKDLRDDAIRYLVGKQHVEQRALAEKLHLHEASISRIVAKKQRTGRPRAKARHIATDQPIRETSEAPSSAPKAFGVREWVQKLAMAVYEIKDKEDRVAMVRAWMTSKDEYRLLIRDLAGELMALATVLTSSS